MASTCPHGFPPGDCLICRTLAGGAPDPGGRSERRARRPRRVPTAAGSRSPDPALGVGPDPTVARPDVVYPPGSPPRGGRAARRPSTHLGAVLLGLVIIALVAWMAVGAVFAVLHLVELVLVAVAAGWAGYRLGYFRGSRARR